MAYLLVKNDSIHVFADALLKGNAKSAFAEEVQTLVRRHRDFGFINKDRMVVVEAEFEHEFDREYVKAHPERREEIYKYAEHADLPKKWYARFRITKVTVENNNYVWDGKAYSIGEWIEV